MRHIDEIIVHCSATRAGADFSASDIDRWHRLRGWNGIGYHYVVRLDGTVEQGRPLEKPGAHCAGHNNRSVGVCYIGGVMSDGVTPDDTRTPAQRTSLLKILKQLRRQFPGARIRSHRDFAAKACPSFDATKEYASL